MSTSSFSMAMAATPTSPSSSSPLFNKISSMPFPPTPLLTKLLLSPKSNSNSLSFTLPHRSRPYLAFSTSGDFDLSEYMKSTELHDPSAETEEELEVEEEKEGKDVEELKESEPPEGGRLYVGNLAYSMTSSQLAEVFGEAGRVDAAEIVYDRVTDRSRGFAFVTMGTVEEAKEAIRMFDGAQIGGRTVKVNFPEVPRGGEREVMGPRIRSTNRAFIESPHKLYAGNLSWVVTSQGLGAAFADQPGFLSAKVIYDRSSGRSRGYGFVSFASAEEVESALNAMNGVEVEGRPLRLNMAAERARPSSPPESSLEENELLSSI